MKMRFDFNKIDFVKKSRIVLFAVLLCMTPFFSQTHDVPDTNISESDSNDDAFFEAEDIDPALQHNFTIIVPVHEYDLNPHTASYSSESQILSSLYERLFSYDKRRKKFEICRHRGYNEHNLKTGSESQ